MPTKRSTPPVCTALAALLFATAAPTLLAQAASSLPATAPTTIAPIAAIATPADQPGARHHHAQVSCAGGELTIHADNSSLNGILRSVSRCTGMTVSGGVADQRVFGDYGPAAPSTVLATLLDGTGVNMLLKETASDQPAQLILTPRSGGATYPAPNDAPDTDIEQASVQPDPSTPLGNGANTGPANMNTNGARPANINPPLQTYQGIGNRPDSAVTSPPSIPLPINNVNGSSSNTSPTASTYPTTNSVPLDSLPTPSTTPSSNGIVDAPNPPAPGSDTAALLNGTTSREPANTNIVDKNTSNQTLPGGTNTTLPAPPQSTLPNANPAPSNGTLTPQQVYDQLRQLQGQQLQRQQNQAQPPAPSATQNPQ